MRSINLPTRSALLISAPGDGKNSQFLPGVSKDVVHLRKFLQSSKGGSWSSNEIIELRDPSIRQVRLAISRLSVDYLLVYFSGHGNTNLAEQRMIALKDGTIADTELLNQSPRQLVIIDACRNHGGSGLSGFEFDDEEINHFEAGTYDYFSQQIVNSPHGKLIVHATQSGLSSYDNSLTGGLFTNALLKVSSRMQSRNDYAPCRIEVILQYLPGVIKNKGFRQIPTIVYQTGGLAVPFSFSMTRKEGELIMKKQRDKKAINDLIGIAAVTVLVICLISAAPSN